MIYIPTAIKDALVYSNDSDVPTLKPTANAKQKAIYAEWLKQLDQHDNDLKIKL